jgi:D-sedoheptulose 7-phosphate isomerase
LYKLAEMHAAAPTVQEYIQSYTNRLHELLNIIDKDAIAATIDAIEQCSQRGNTLFSMANGGSAASASHLVNDLVAGCYLDDRAKLRTLCLSDNVATVTALGNDAGFDHIFSHQLRVHMRPGDVVLAMSVSGNSENLIQAVDYANANGATTIAYAGFDGGRLAKKCQISVVIPTTKDEYGPVEDVFNILGHIVITYIAMSRGKYLHH